MKKILLLFLLFCVTSTLLAQTFTFDGIKYNITSTTEPRKVEVGENGFVQGASPQTYFAGVANIPETVTHNGLSYSVTSIGTNAFNGCTNLTAVTLPNTVEYLASRAFYRCEKLSNISIPDAVTGLGYSAFEFSGLTAITIPNSVYSIFDSCFANCRQLASVSLSNTLPIIRQSLFQNCTALQNISLPSSLESIANNAFENTGLTSISIPEGVTIIAKRAFNSCDKLNSVILPASLTKIDDDAFGYCRNLYSVTINSLMPPQLRKDVFIFLYDNFFQGELKVPFGSLAAYQNHSEWRKFQKIYEQIPVGSTFNVGGINYTVADDTTAPTEVNVASSPSFAGAAIIPELVPYSNRVFKVVAISSGAFANNTALTSVSIPNSVRGIGGGFFGSPSAFEHCSNLTSVTLGNGLTSMGQGAFGYCTALTTVTNLMQTPLSITADVFFNVPLANITLRVPAGKIPTYEAEPVWTDFGSIASPQVGDTFSVNNINYAITAISPALTAAVASNDTVTGVVDLPASVTHNGDTFAVTGIATDAFKNASITAITIPSTITSIADGAFTNCTALTAVTVNNTVPVAITAAVFTGTTISAATLTVPFGTAAAYEATAVWTDFTIVAPIPAPVVGQTFNFDGINYVVTKATTPYEVAVGSNIYIAINPVSIPASVWNAGSSFAVTSIADNAFNATLNIAGTTTLTNVFSFTIPNSVKVIGAYAFNGCAFSSFTIPNSVVNIGGFAFGNTELRSIEIPSSVVSIDQFAFSNCIYLKSVHIPSSITSIGDYAFYDCNALKSVTVNWTAPLAINAIVFDRVNLSNSTLHVPAGSVAAYESAAVWTDFNPIQEIVPAPVFGQTFTVNGINYIVTKATTPYEVAVGTHTGFVGAANIPATVTFAGNSFTVKSISYLAFNENESLTAVTIPNTVTQIGDEAFFGCVNLTTATIGTGVTSIGANAFGSCKLTTIDIPSSVVSIGELAFQTNATLSSVKVNWANPITIGADVFSNIVLATVILYVPAGKVAIYQDAAVWKSFNPIREHGATAVTPTFAAVAPVCSGATIAALPITSVNAISGTWSPAINNTATTTYTFTPSAGQDATTATLEIVVNAIPTVPTASAQNFTVASTVANLVPAPSATINWYDAPLGGTALASTTALATGTYYVSETNANGCESARTSVAVTVNTTVTPVLHDTFTFNGINYLIVKNTAPYEVVVTATPDFNGTAEIPAIVTHQGNSFAVTAIGVNAFQNASGLTGLIIPNSVIRIATNAFANSTNLGAVVVPNSVISIGNYAFTGCTALTSIEISETLQSIGDGAFDGCTSLATISLPASLITIGEAAFAGCTGLTAVTVGATTPLVINADVFLTVNLGSVRLNVPAGALAAYQAAAVWQNFSPIAEPAPPVVGDLFTSNGLNYTITSAVLPYTVEVANNVSFVGAANIPTTVAIAGNTFAVTSIATNAFQNCNGLTAVIIPNSVTSIGIGAFERCTNLVSVSLPTSLTTISSYAFSYCERLTTINIPSSITTIESNAFRECSGLIAISLPNSITSLGHSAFQLCYNLVTVNIPNTLTRLEDYLFESCIAIKSIEIPITVTHIGAYSLKNMGLTAITIPSSVTRISNFALSENTGLTTLNIPETVTRIDDGAFNYCIGLKSITVNWTTPVSVLRTVFTHIPIATVVLNVPTGTQAAYAAAPVWSEFIITEPNNNVTPPPTATAQTFCNTASVSNLVATGTNLKWYNVASAGTALLSTDTVVSATYYVSQTIAGVESARTSVVIVVNPLPAVPTAVAQNFMVASTVASLVPAPSATIKWYDAATGGTALAATTAIATGTYYVSETNANNCESARTSVPITVNTAINYCRNAVAQPLASPFAGGTAVKWYTVATGGRALTGAPTPSTATVGTRLWYVSSVINGIESARETITVNTVALPLQPSSITGTTSVGVLVGSNNTATYTIAFVADAASYKWTVPAGVQIVAGQGTNTVTLNFLNVSNLAGIIGNISVAAVNANGCTGTARVLALKSAIPTAPARITMTDPTAIDPAKAITNISTFIGTNKVLTLTAAVAATASSYQWELAPGVTQLSGGNTNTITVDFAGVNAGITSLYIGVKSVNGVGVSTNDNSSRTPTTASTARLLALTATLPNATPTVAGQIVGLCGAVSYSYTVTAVANANSYQITAPTGAIVTSVANVSNNSNSLSTSDLMFTVTYPAGFVATTALPATLEVRAANGVGASTKSRILNLSNALPAFRTPTGSAGITTFTRTGTQTFTVADVMGATTYNWSVANGAVLVSGQGTNTITVDFAAVPLATTSTRVTVVAANACGVSNAIRTLSLRLATPTTARLASEAIAVSTTEVYPNPIVSDFTIDVIASKVGVLELSIYTTDGVLIRKPKALKFKVGDNNITENIASFPTGVYILQLVNSASNAVITKKLIKK